MMKQKKKVSDYEVIAAWKEFEQTGKLKDIAERIGLKVGSFRKRAKKLGLYTPQKQKRDYNIDDCNQWAKENDLEGKGFCVEDEYLGQNEKHRWKCSNPDHEVFHTIAKLVKNGTWCQKCYNERRSETFQKYSIKDCIETAAMYNGKCLSLVYSTNKMKWKCEFDHEFRLTYNEVKNYKRWCKTCDRYKNEKLTRFIFETIFGTEFKKTNLVRLGLSDKKLELDGYAPELRMAFEYNGVYHTEDETHPLFNPKTLENDAEKALICAENNITLIVIPEYPKGSPKRWALVEKVLKENKIKIPSYVRPEDLPPTYRNEYHNRIEDLINTRGGKLKTKVVFTATDKIEFFCDEGHLVTSITPHKLLQGQWCKHNMKSRKLSEADIQARSENVHSKFLGTYRKPNGNRMWRMKCDEGHVYERKLSHIREGYGCNHTEHRGQSRFERYDDRHDKYAFNE